MTEVDWRACSHPHSMLPWLMSKGLLSPRQRQLFALACCRRAWGPLVKDAGSRAAVEAAERHLDGEPADLEQAIADATHAADRYGARVDGDRGTALDVAIANALYAVELALREESAIGSHRPREFYVLDVADILADALRMGGFADSSDEVRAQSCLLRDVVGNPFRPAALDPSWLKGNGGAALSLARAIHEERAFDLFPILADALEDAGCSDPEVLAHCRGPGPHARGCWLLDLLLGKGGASLRERGA